MGKKERHTQTKQATTTTRTSKGLKSSTAGAMREGRQAKNQNVGKGPVWWSHFRQGWQNALGVCLAVLQVGCHRQIGSQGDALGR